MAVQLWCSMMLLALITITFMWGFQIYFMEQNYINSNIREVQEQLTPVLSELAVADLAGNGQMLSYLGSASGGKMMLIDQKGQLIALYSYGYPIDLEENRVELQIWEQIMASDEYQKVLDRVPYSKEQPTSLSLSTTLSLTRSPVPAMICSLPEIASLQEKLSPWLPPVRTILRLLLAKTAAHGTK